MNALSRRTFLRGAGVALTLCAPDERGLLRDIERLTRQPLTAVGQRPAESEARSPAPRSQPNRSHRGGGNRHNSRSRAA